MNELLTEKSSRTLDYEEAGFRRSTDFYKSKLPKALLIEENKPFFDFIEKMCSFEDKFQFWLWILDTQFNILTAKGKFLDNLGNWLGLSRPPIPNRRTTKPVVIFGKKIQESGMTAEEYEKFVLLHNLTSDDENGTQNSFYPLRSFVGETLVNDEEYRLYILGILKLKEGITFLNILNVFVRILVYPFFMTKNTPSIIEFTAHPEETQNRLFIIREITYKLRTTGLNITVTQALTEDTPEIKAVYGEDCWNMKNPVLDTDKYLKELASLY